MKLIDILVRELPKRGGWPIDSDDERTLTATLPDICWGLDSGGYYAFRGPCDSVSHKLYEETLLALKSGWDGEGLPPVGLEIEYMFTKVNYRTDFSRGKVLAYGMHNVFMEHWSSKNEFIQPLDKIEFRPIRSETDKKRDEDIEAMRDVGLTLPAGIRFSLEEMTALYDYGFRRGK